jgi:hypothetical protein
MYIPVPHCKGYHPEDTGPNIHLSQCQGAQRGYFSNQNIVQVQAAYIEIEYRYTYQKCTDLYPMLRGIILGIRSLVFPSVSARLHREATSPIKTLYRYRHNLL